jgi:hypothetical protein
MEGTWQWLWLGARTKTQHTSFVGTALACVRLLDLESARARRSGLWTASGLSSTKFRSRSGGVHVCSDSLPERLFDRLCRPGNRKRTEEAAVPGPKLIPLFLPDGRIGFLTKWGRDEGDGYAQFRNLPLPFLVARWPAGGLERVDYRPCLQDQLFIAGIRIAIIDIRTFFQACRRQHVFWLLTRTLLPLS